MESSLGTRDDKQRVNMINIEAGDNEEPQTQMTKTRSYGDLMHAPDHVAYLHRRLSDPSISIEKYVINNFAKFVVYNNRIYNKLTCV